MPTREENQVPTAHWSIDYVEHLRKVHFGLIALSAAVLILLSNSRDSQMSKALTQAIQITEMREHWPDVQRAILERAVQSLKAYPLGRNYYVTIKARTPRLKNGIALLVVKVTREELFKFTTWKFPSVSMEFSPRTLSEFSAWWNKLQTDGLQVDIPDLQETGEKCMAVLGEQDGDSFAPVIDPEGRDVEAECHVGWTDEFFKAATTFMAQATGSLAPEFGMPSKGGTLPGLQHTYVQTQFTNVYEWTVGGKKHTTGVVVHIPTGFLSVTFKDASLSGLFPAWGAGSFDMAFRELASVSRDLTNIPLSNMQARVAEMQPKGEQEIEAFGLKIPAAEVTMWGLGLLLAVQFYFWLHLHEFNRKVDRSSPGRDVAWIGVYGSRIAFGAMLLSACILPLGALFELVRRLPGDLPRTWISHLALTVTICASIVGCALAVGTAERLWRLRTIIRGAEPA
jgi:hypothetical protein